MGRLELSRIYARTVKAEQVVERVLLRAALRTNLESFVHQPCPLNNVGASSLQKLHYLFVSMLELPFLSHSNLGLQSWR